MDRDTRRIVRTGLAVLGSATGLLAISFPLLGPIFHLPVNRPEAYVSIAVYAVIAVACFIGVWRLAGPADG